MNRAQAQRRHTRRRAMERFGFDLSGQEYQQIVEQITSDRAPMMERESQRVSFHEVQLRGQKAVAVYDAKLNQIRTLLSRRMFGKDRRARVLWSRKQWLDARRRQFLKNRVQKGRR